MSAPVSDARKLVLQDQSMLIAAAVLGQEAIKALVEGDQVKVTTCLAMLVDAVDAARARVATRSEAASHGSPPSGGSSGSKR